LSVGPLARREIVVLEERKEIVVNVGPVVPREIAARVDLEESVDRRDATVSQVPEGQREIAAHPVPQVRKGAKDPEDHRGSTVPRVPREIVGTVVNAARKEIVVRVVPRESVVPREKKGLPVPEVAKVPPDPEALKVILVQPVPRVPRETVESVGRKEIAVPQVLNVIAPMVKIRLNKASESLREVGQGM
jgi:hypothetical protein